MSTVFGVPCPDCGHLLSVVGERELECPTCERSYQTRLGHLFPVGDVVPPDRPPGREPTGRAKAATS
jgi:hypothetical protein